MDEFTKQVSDLINQEVDKRAEKIVKERLYRVAKNLIKHFSISDISNCTGLTNDEVRESLQEIIDAQNNILKFCGKADELETIESFFH